MSSNDSPKNLYLRRLTSSWRRINPYSQDLSLTFGPSADRAPLANIPDPRTDTPPHRAQQRQQISFESAVGIRRRFANPIFEISSDGFPSRLVVHEDVRTCGVYLTGFTLRRSNCARRLSSHDLVHVIAPALGKLDVTEVAFGCSVFYSGFQSAFYRPVVRAAESDPKKAFCVHNEGWFCSVTLLPHVKCGLRAIQNALNNFVWNDTVIQARCCPLGK